MVSQAAMALSLTLLVYCLLLEDPLHVDQEVKRSLFPSQRHRTIGAQCWVFVFWQLVSIPLLNAAESGHVEDVKLLLEHGADISQRNYYGLTGK